MNGPDAARYWHAAGGGRVPRPFNMRWLLPAICGQDERRWWIVYVGGWLLSAVGMASWASAMTGDWRIAVAASALLLGLPGFLGPQVSIPIQVDAPATGLTLCGVAAFEHGHHVLGVALVVVASMIRETSTIWAALWTLSPWMCVGLVVPIVAHLLRPTGPDPLGGKFQWIADHPVASAMMYHRGRWRDGWLLVAPWGVTLAALVEPSWWLIGVLVVAHLQLFVATDTVRIVAHAAGPAMALAAAQVIPVEWLLLTCVLHVWWFKPPERV